MNSLGGEGNNLDTVSALKIFCSYIFSGCFSISNMVYKASGLLLSAPFEFHIPIKSDSSKPVIS